MLLTNHSDFLPAPSLRPQTAPLCLGADTSYINLPGTFQGESLQKIHTSALSTTFAGITRRLAQPIIFETYSERRSSADPVSSPPRVLIEIARRCGLLAAAVAHDAGLSVPAIAVRP